MPVLLAVIGLILALLADGFGDPLSWLTRGSQLSVAAFFWLRPANRGT